MKDSFKSVSATQDNPKWEELIKRANPLYSRNNDLRSEFARDYTRILHSNAYRRLKHKTQVFYSPENDHICTRIEHVNYVESISYTIANYLGLNTELAKAIAAGHDVGHSPFGHAGEKVLSEISKRDIGQSFWHERNGLYMVDYIELLEDRNGKKKNLDLTYAVRDGIISHCGEIDENGLKPREEYIDLNDYKYPNQYSPYTWEGCVVKIADKISYLGRDIEDAISLGILDEKLKDLHKILKSKEVINNTVIINNLIWDLCQNSSPEKGLCFSDETFYMLKEIKEFNYKHIYAAPKFRPAIRYFSIVLNEIYFTLKSTYDGKNTIYKMRKLKKLYPEVIDNFQEWLENYWNQQRKDVNLNDIIINMEDEKSFSKAIIYYISGMTDNFAIDTYNKIIGF